MLLDRAKIAPAALRFLASRHPVVLLTVPGCGPCAISPAHWTSPDLRFPEAQRILISTVEEFTELVAWIAFGDPPGPSARLQKALTSITCYCAEVSSILALRQKDCVHEAQYRQFRDYRGALLSLPGWEFNLIPERSKPSRRVYRVIRTHSRLLATGASPVLSQIEGLLEIRLVGSGHLLLIIEDSEGGTALKARVEVARGAIAMPAFSEAIDRQNLPPYNVLDDYLQRALRDPVRAKEILHEAKETLAGGADGNYAVQEILASLLKPPTPRGKLSPTLLKKRIRDIRSRLWDAPVIAGKIRNRLDAALANPAFMKRASRLSLEIQSDLASLTMPLAKLEAGDSYLDRVA